MKPLARIAELLEHQWPYTMAVLRRRFGLPVYEPPPEMDELPFEELERIMREPPKPGRGSDAK